MTIGKVDCTKEMKLCYSQGIARYPTLKLFEVLNVESEEKGIRYLYCQVRYTLCIDSLKQIGTVAIRKDIATAALISRFG